MIDLRSDTFSLPSKEMMDTIINAKLGDDVWGEDPTVIELESLTAKILGKEKLSEKLLEKAEILKKNFNQKFWMEKEKYFCLALDGRKRQVKEISSNPGHLLFTGIIEKKKEKFVVKKLFSSELWTPFGIRTHSKKSKLFDPFSYHLGSIWPHDNWLIAQGFKKLGYKKEYNRIKNALLLSYQNIGFLPEYYGVINNTVTLKMKKISSYPQAWASGALLNFLSVSEK